MPSDRSADTDASGLVWPAKLFPFQVVGVERLVVSESLLLADEMGLGKTIQVAAAIRRLFHGRDASSALVVVPKGLVLQWRRQLRTWAPELSLSTVVGASDERRVAWAQPAAVFITSYEALRADIWLPEVSGPARRDWDVVVLDEAQRIKTPTSELGQAVKCLRRRRSWALTGTPLENRLDDVISILDFVAPGRFDPSRRALGLRQLLAEVQLRRRRSEVLADLPPKLASTVHLELTARQYSAYRKAELEGLIWLSSLGRDIRITHVLELILRLKQICNFCPETGASAKLEDLRERLERATASGEKALVFSQFVDESFGARRIAAALRQHKPLLLTGDIDPSERAAIVAAFERDPARRVMVLSLRAGGIGLNLTVASQVFHFDRWWNPAVEAQAEDRAHRIGQERPVHVAAYLSENTVEERIDEILHDKQALFADVIDGVDATHLRRLDLDTLLTIVRYPRPVGCT
jgi:SNF2 family DNA or RNA helicase